MQNIIQLIIILVCFSHILKAQTYKYGDVSKELLTLVECPIDKDAKAMVTTMTGKNEIKLSQSEGFRSEFTQKFQIKIFKSDAKDLGTREHYYYSPKSGKGKVEVSTIRGKTYNLVNGQITETKLEKENIFYTQVNNYFKKLTIAVPNLQDNSVFEYELQFDSDYFANINDWYIQELIPVQYNSLTTSIPEFFKYQINVKGAFIPVKYETNATSQTVYFKLIYSNGLIRRSSEYEKVPIKYENKTIIFESIPALEPEQFSTSIEDQKAKISHQLTLISFPNSPSEVFATDYQRFTKDLLESSTFGKVLQKGEFIDKMVTFKNDTPHLEKLNKVLQHFHENILWDGSEAFNTNFSGKELFETGKGNAADINLNYIAALRHLGVTTFPIILSTRNNSTPHPVYPNYSDFNYVIAATIIDSTVVFSDATSKLPAGSLPLRALTSYGWLVDLQKGEWTDLKKGSMGKQTNQINISLVNNQVVFEGTLIRQSHLAYKDINGLSENEKQYLKDISTINELEKDTFVISDKKLNSIRYKVKYHQDVQDDQILYIKPFLFLPFASNPFTLPERKSVIDFPYAKEYKYITTLNIPDGYIHEVPANINAILNENDIVLKYTSSFNPEIKKITIIIDLKLTKSSYTTLEYADFKNAIDSIIAKINEPIVLKKI